MRFDWWRGDDRDAAFGPPGRAGDPGLALAVAEFRQALVPVLAPVMAAVPDGRPELTDDDVVLEAFNLTCAFIDADGLSTDDELWALLATFAPLLDPRFASMTPDAARRSGLTEHRRRLLDEPSAMFEILAGLDERDGSDHATTYLHHAVAIGHMVASLDDTTTRTELEAIERFRANLLDRIRRITTARSGPSAPGPGAAAGPASAGPVPPTPPTSAAPAATTAATADTATAAEPEPLPPARPLPELLAELDALIGLAAVKQEVRLVADLLQVQKLREERGLATMRRSHHLVFTGNPGTGKTTVARLIAQIYRTLGVVARGQLVETDRSGLVAGYVGQTATKVVEVFESADGGVLLIDEAYALVRGSESDFGREAIDTIVKLVEDRRDRTVVIMAGYPGEMRELIEANPGLRSRFPTTIHFPDYTDDELLAIFTDLAHDAHYELDPAATAAVRAWFVAQPRTAGFGNGRLARNLFEAAVGRQAGRVVAIDEPTDLQLVTLMADDIPPADDPSLTG